jgi:peptidoglycan hydrolase CwlO-like protein
MRLKTGFYTLICLLFFCSAFAEENNLEEKMRQLSVDVPKQQAELDSRLQDAQEEIARLRQQLLAAQEQLVTLETSHQESEDQIKALNEKIDYLRREIDRLGSSTGEGESREEKFELLNTELKNFKKSLIRSTAIALPVLLGLGIFF